jgi:hypothetical protein
MSHTEESWSPELSLATLPEIAAELRRRDLAFALVVDRLLSGGDVPGGDVPSEDRSKVYASVLVGQEHPALTACFLFDGILWCLNDCLTVLDTATVVELSRQVNTLKETLFRAWKQAQPENAP